MVDELNKNEEINCLGVIDKVISGRSVECSNIQVSLVQQVLGNDKEKTSFVGKIGRRHARMPKCVFDQARAVPSCSLSQPGATVY